MKRPPVIVVMGHVDHGKTTLLDYIRKTSVAAREAGGITQSIGAYEITHSLNNAETKESAEQRGNKITFIDTPGHEAFNKMRARGAGVADIAVLVVAADDGVKPQTKEAISIIKEAGISFIVAINKIDKANADINRVKNDLTQEGVLLEGYGGNVSFQPLSAKTGEGVHELMDLILLAAEMEDLSYDPAAPASGYVLESRMDSKRGVTATVIIKNGTLRVGEQISSGTATGKIKILENFLGEQMKEMKPSSPALVLGFESPPIIGEQFYIGEPGVKIKKPQMAAKPATESIDENTVSVMLKADTAGSLEALSEVVGHIPAPENVRLMIVAESVGDITDGDVKLAVSTKAIIIGFNVKANKAAENVAKAQGIKITTSKIIYELTKFVEDLLQSRGKEEVKGDLEILAVFGKKGSKQIVGGRVVKGEIKNNAKIELVRKEEVVGMGKIVNLQHNKKDAVSVTEGKEAGLLVDSDVEIKTGDHLILR